MNLKEQVMDVRETQAYWKGVVAGVIGSAVFFSALITLIYYMVQIVQAVKLSRLSNRRSKLTAAGNAWAQGKSKVLLEK